MKNVLLFHLESVSNLIFRTNPDCFPNLIKFIRDAAYYPNYYSTATSTYMVITDLFFGDNMQFEKSNDVEDIFSIKPTKKSAFDKLFERGYKTKCYCFGFKAGEKAKEHAKVYCSKAECWESPNDIDGMVEDLKDCFREDVHFAVFVQDLESHWMNLEAFSDGKKSSYDLFMYKYKMLDRTFGRVLDALRESGKYDDTLIVAYGDHGDDLWGHGLHEGYTHAIEPFPFLVNCPLVIKNGPECDTKALISTLDLHDLIFSASVVENISFCKKRNVLVSRNLFSSQHNCEESFNKSYMVTDGKYSLLVSGNGLRLFCNGIDPACGRNMLDFFILKGNKIVYNKSFDQLHSSHYKFFMTCNQVTEFENVFNTLFRELNNYVTNVYGTDNSKMDFCNIDYSDEVKNNEGLQLELSARRIINTVKGFVKKIFR